MEKERIDVRLQAVEERLSRLETLLETLSQNLQSAVASRSPEVTSTIRD